MYRNIKLFTTTNEINTGEGSVNDDNIECIKTEDVNLALLIYSTGEEHPYGHSI